MAKLYSRAFQRNTQLLQISNLQRPFSVGQNKYQSSKFGFKISKKVQEDLEEKNYKPKNHPGIMKLKCIYLPSELVQAVLKAKEEFGYSSQSLMEDSVKLSKYMWSREPPFEAEDLKEALRATAIKLVKKGSLSISFLSDKCPKTLETLSDNEKKQLKMGLKQQVYNWKPTEFTDYTCFVYLWARLAPDYAALLQIFHEIKKRKEDFSPQFLFDFGSGVGSVMWAANATWSGSLREIYNVDSSSSMLKLSERLFSSRNCDGQSKLNVYYRQFLPASENLKYNLVVSSRSLLELGNLENRIKTVDILWRKVSDGGFLVLIEAGSKFGYTVLMEARDYLLNVNRLESEKFSVEKPMNVFSPCPHDNSCPRLNHVSKVPCHFQALYHNFITQVAAQDSFSYIVIHKGKRKDEQNWPRIVQPVLKKRGHTITRACTPCAAIREFTATKAKHGTECYQVCKNSNWGDFLPISIDEDAPAECSESSEDLPCQTSNL